MGAISRLPLPERFWARVKKSDQCWIWAGATDRLGYGRITIDGRRTGAHRYSLQLSLGRELRADEFACHRCDTPVCVRPDHLFAGSNADNMRDCVSKGLFRPVRGSANAFAKLTEADVVAILVALAAGASQQSQARKYGVSRQPIWLIAHGKGWNHVRRLP